MDDVEPANVTRLDKESPHIEPILNFSPCSGYRRYRMVRFSLDVFMLRSSLCVLLVLFPPIIGVPVDVSLFQVYGTSVYCTGLLLEFPLPDL